MGKVQNSPPQKSNFNTGTIAANNNAQEVASAYTGLEVVNSAHHFSLGRRPDEEGGDATTAKFHEYSRASPGRNISAGRRSRESRRSVDFRDHGASSRSPGTATVGASRRNSDVNGNIE